MPAYVFIAQNRHALKLQTKERTSDINAVEGPSTYYHHFSRTKENALFSLLLVFFLNACDIFRSNVKP